MASSAQFAATPRAASAIVQIGDSNRLTPLANTTIFTAGASGSRIDNIDIEALGPTTATALRLFIYDGVNYDLWDELLLAAATPNSTTLGTSAYLATVANSILPLVLPTGYSLRAALNDTQIVTAASPTSIAASQTVSAGAYATLNGGTVVAASATAVAAAQTLGGAGPMTLSNTAGYQMTNPCLVSLTSTGNISGVTFTIIGVTKAGVLTTENLAGPNNNTVFSANAYWVVLAIFASGAVATNTSAGYSTFYPQAVPSPIIVGSQGNLAASSIKITGVDSRGNVLSESIAGPNNSFVSTVNSYAGILTVLAVNALGTAITIGNPEILSGYKISARGGDF